MQHVLKHLKIQKSINYTVPKSTEENWDILMFLKATEFPSKTYKYKNILYSTCKVKSIQSKYISAKSYQKLI